MAQFRRNAIEKKGSMCHHLIQLPTELDYHRSLSYWYSLDQTRWGNGSVGRFTVCGEANEGLLLLQLQFSISWLAYPILVNNKKMDSVKLGFN